MPPEFLDGLYTWVRDTRLGEITLIQANIYRIFLQSQLFLFLTILAPLCYMLFAESDRENTPRIWLLLSLSALFASLSRSFWLALLITGVLVLAEIVRRRTWKTLLSRTADVVALTIAGLALLWVLVALPISSVPGAGIFGSVMKGRATTTSDTAIDSRNLLLDPMLEQVWQAPLAGSGLGTTVTYTTKDQRYIDNNGTDQVTTYAFEWGWIDLVIKFGLVGTLIFIWFGLLVLKDLWTASQQDKPRAWLYLTVLFALIALVITHFFSPYLNHPLGWAFLALAVGLLPRESQQVTEDDEEATASLSLPAALPTARDSG